MNSDRLRIGISGLPLGNRSGTGYFTEQLLRVLSERGRARFEVTVLGGHNLKDRVPGHSVRSVSSLSLRWPFRFLADPLSRRIRSELDLLHYPNSIGPVQSRTPIVATLHDISPFACPETLSWKQVVYLKRVFAQVAEEARGPCH